MGAMEDDERPRKIVKTSHNGQQISSISTSQADSELAITNGTAAETLNGLNTEENPKVTSAQVSDDAGLPAPQNVAPLLSGIPESQDAPMSKNAMKKLRKKQEWEAQRSERKLIRKEKIAARKERRKMARQQEIAENGHLATNPKAMSLTPKPVSVRVPLTIMIDCDFDDLMRDGERISLAGQITRSYSVVRASPFRADLAICSFGGHLKDRFENVLEHHKHWRGVRWLSEDFVAAGDQARQWMTDDTVEYKFGGAFAKYADMDADALQKVKDQAEVIYLTAESDYTLTELNPYSTYIVGGLVDKNREKGLCHRRAVQRGVRTARLPIGEFLELHSRKVLATNHVCEIMVEWLECGDWGQAFMKIIPKRKGGKLKEAEDGAESTSRQIDEHEGEHEDDAIIVTQSSSSSASPAAEYTDET